MFKIFSKKKSAKLAKIKNLEDENLQLRKEIEDAFKKIEDLEEIQAMSTMKFPPFWPDFITT